MARSYRELRERMSPEAGARADRRVQEMIDEMPLQVLRQARNLSQEELAMILRVNQAAISKLERRTDMYISTLRRFVKAMGGELEIRASFPEGSVRIGQFGKLADERSGAARVTG